MRHDSTRRHHHLLMRTRRRAGAVALVLLIHCAATYNGFGRKRNACRVTRFIPATDIRFVDLVVDITESADEEILRYCIRKPSTG